MASPRSLRPQTAAALVQQVQRLAGTDPNSSNLCRLLLMPLTREDSERPNNLIATLRAYYACGMRVDLTADRLFLHRNSVRYRLDRIRSLLQMNIDEPQSITALMLALNFELGVQERSNAG
jgi:PucR family transcriptional regulator, purine catabolism regulatory protein